MAKYVCDFDQVNNIANRLEELANTMTDTVDSYVGEINGILASWKGESKTNFINSNNEKSEEIKKNIVPLNQASKYLKEVVSKIQNAEEELSSLSI